MLFGNILDYVFSHMSTFYMPGVLHKEKMKKCCAAKKQNCLCALCTQRELNDLRHQKPEAERDVESV